MQSDSKEIKLEVHFDKMVIQVPVGSLPYKILLAEGHLFEAENNQEIEEFLEFCEKPNAQSWVGYLEQKKTVIFIGIIILAALVITVPRYVLPWMGDQVANWIPQSWLMMAGDETLAILDESFFSPSELTLQDQEKLTHEFNRMASLVLKDQRAKLVFRQSEEIGPNAFALPGGVVVLTDKLVEITEDQAGVIGVLAHELGHVHLKHPARRLVRSLMALALVSLIFDDAATFAEELAAVSGSLISLAYTREFEEEADRAGKEILIRAGFSPIPLANLLQKLSDGCQENCSQLPEWLTTHPSVPSRIEFLLSE
ncbi:MAG: M48 family metallopeptidase [SAR324 cluster bacterium]|nr:M48 family metallopeptidase [SAR324 cluster bacterium]